MQCSSAVMFVTLMTSTCLQVSRLGMAGCVRWPPSIWHLVLFVIQRSSFHKQMVSGAAGGPRSTGACQANLKKTPPFLQGVALNEQVSPGELSRRGELSRPCLTACKQQPFGLAACLSCDQVVGCLFWCCFFGGMQGLSGALAFACHGHEAAPATGYMQSTLYWVSREWLRKCLPVHLPGPHATRHAIA